MSLDEDSKKPMDSDIKVEFVMVKEEPQVANSFVKCEICNENTTSEKDCVHLNDRLRGLEKELDNVSTTSSVKLKLENTECSSKSDEGSEGSLFELQNAEITVKDENFIDSSDYLPTDLSEFDTKRVKIEDETSTESIKFVSVKEELDETSSDILIQDEKSLDVKQESFPSTEVDETSRVHQKNQGIHTGKKPFQCKICGIFFSQQSHFNSHQKVHAGQTFKCIFCSKNFTQHLAFTMHERTHDGETPFQCRFCRKSYAHHKALITHERIHFNENAAMKKHSNRPTRKKPYQCEICDKYFLCPNDLIIHEKIHAGEKPLQCKLCPESFSRLSSLKSHERTHREMKHSGEERCLKSYTNGDSSGNIKKPYTCEICLKYFSKKHVFDRHILNHTAEELNRRGDLIIHEKVHADEKQLQYKFCSKSFPRFTLKYHERTHSEINHSVEKLFHCKLCSKSYAHISSLKIHEKTHKDLQPYKCKVCPKSFSRQSSLNRHNKIHAGEKPNKCKMCEKSFIQRGDLIVHERTHTGEKSFQCRFCSKRFFWPASLGKHERRHEGIKRGGESFAQSATLENHQAN